MPRVRTPTPLRKARGNPGKRPYNKREPKLKAGAPQTPAGLDKVAAAEWQHLIEEARELGVLTKVDRGIVYLAARAFSEYEDAAAEVKKSGSTYETVGTEGQRIIKAHPAASIRADAWRRYRTALSELGLSPASRSKVSTVDQDDEEAASQHFH